MVNSIGIIDESYCGDNDIWRFPALAMRSAHIEINDRICQFRIVKNRDINIEVVDKLDNKDRGGIGSTGKN
jgi:dUTP pyrophosphatase